MGQLHGELVPMREWVRATGAKICVVLEGPDTGSPDAVLSR
jgi:polyphosphate kinase 2 (PPK2 family)